MIVASSYSLPYEQIGKNEPVCIADEVPFEIPDSWEWVRASTLGYMVRGKGIKRTETVENGLPCVRYGEIYTSYNESFSMTKSFISARLDQSCNHFSKGDVVFTLTGENKVDIAKAIAYMGDIPVAAGGDMAYWTAHGMDPMYLVFFMTSPYCIEQKRRVATGDIIVHISTSKVGSFLVPVPPLEEQHRIVKKVSEIAPSLAEYNEKDVQAQELNSVFPEQLKKSILQWAVQGKLVPQDPSDEPASVLLERIREEKSQLIKEGKIKKDKNESIIYRRDNSHYEELDGREQCIDDEIPFDIPASWEWRRLRSIAKLQTGTTPPTGNRDYFGSGFPFIKPGDISLSGIDYCNESLTELGSKKSRLIPQESVLMVCIGGSIGKCYYTDRDVCCNQQINAASPIFINHKYLWIVLSNDYVNKCIIATAGGTATPIINKSLWGELLIPIPPLNEQVQIVSIVEALETSIKIL